MPALLNHTAAGRNAISASLPFDLRERGLPHAHLKIGEGIVTSKDILISTVLGSCVSVTLYHPQTHLAGIFHAMLPNSKESKRVDGVFEPCKFVDTAVELIYNEFRKRGVPNSEIVAKLFGGAFSMNQGAKDQLRGIVDVGGKNVAQAKAAVDALGLTISKEHVHGERGRKLVFDTSTGEVWLKSLGKAEYQTAASRVASREKMG